VRSGWLLKSYRERLVIANARAFNQVVPHLGFVAASLEVCSEQHDPLQETTSEPVLVIEEQRLRPSLSCWKFGYEGFWSVFCGAFLG
jgi:hypothetical protein